MGAANSAKQVVKSVKEFVAYLRRLKRDLADIKEAIQNGDTERAVELLEALEDDTQKDIET